jgi:hypothetical protein
MALEKSITKESEPFMLSLDFIAFDGYIMDCEYLWDKPAEEIINICDEEGNFKIDNQLKEEIKKSRTAERIPGSPKPNLRCTSRDIKVKIICYKPITPNQSERDAHPVYFTPREYILLGRPKVIEERVVRRYQPSKGD